MATITRVEPETKSDVPSPHAEARFLLHDVSWEVYEALRDAGANYHIRMTYDNGSLELMSPSQKHEEYATWFAIFLIEIAAVLGIPCKSLRSTTWRKRKREKGKEADDCFYIANLDRVRGREIDLRVDPPPDLAVEVEISRSALNALSIYAALGVPEVWRFDGETFRIHLRQADGSYIESDRSPSLPFLQPSEVVHWMQRAEEIGDDAAWKEEVRAWAQAELVPRHRPA